MHIRGEDHQVVIPGLFSYVLNMKTLMLYVFYFDSERKYF